MNEKIERDFILPNTLNAMAKTFYVKTAKNLKQDDWYIKQGSTVTGVKVIAQGEKIREVQRLVNTYTLSDGKFTSIKDWYKVRGTAIVTNGNDIYKNSEVHWYQCENIGKVEMKLKVLGDKVES